MSFFLQEIEQKMSRLERLTEEEQQLFENIGSEEQHVGRWKQLDGVKILKLLAILKVYQPAAKLTLNVV